MIVYSSPFMWYNSDICAQAGLGNYLFLPAVSYYFAW